MSDVENTISGGLRDLGDMIRETMRRKGITDTGTSSEFEVRSVPGKVQLLGVDYLEYLDRGRPPGKFPPLGKIREYVQRNNIRIADYSEEQTIYLIGKGIAERGTAIYRDKSKGIELDRLLAETLEKIYGKVGEAAVNDAKKFLKI